MIGAGNANQAASLSPRVFLIDMTRIGDATATGELKSALFAGWPKNALMQLFVADGDRLGVFSNNGERTFANGDGASVSVIEKLARQFDPEVILYRPAPRTAHLHHAAMQLIERLQKPLVTWIMDDWPAALAHQDSAAAAGLERDWRDLLQRSVVRLSISDAMSGAFQRRYGLSFAAVANGVDPADWPEAPRKEDGVLKVRYAGSLAENMTLSSVVMVARAVEQLVDQGVKIKFEIKTREMWRRLAAPHLKDFKNTHMVVADLEPSKYRAWLREADITVIAYNFDTTSKTYIQYSLANKLPECLASGAPLLAVGPSDVATISALDKLDVGVRVTKSSVDEVAIALTQLAKESDRRQRLGAQARRVAFQHFNIFAAREKLAHALYTASRRSACDAVVSSEEPRSVGAHLDETAIVARLLSGRRGRKHVMIDVGAHFGTSASYFEEMGWTIHCFEPDPANRVKLEQRYAGVSAVSIDARAVGDEPKRDVLFYASQESTGISGLSAFRESHEEVGRVDVTTVEEIIRERSISSIDFLKIDVEGFDYAVLKGVPWETIRPDVVECEFEDAKTIPMGHRWRDTAAYLVARDYTVYISEWHPIIRYGIPHDWRRINLFTESTEIPADAWGNLLAFKDDPGFDTVRSAFSSSLRRRNGLRPEAMPVNIQTNAKHAPQPAGAPPAVARPFYAVFGERLKRRSPRLFAMVRLFRRALAAMWRRWFLVAPAAVVFGLIFFAGLAQPDFQSRVLISGGALLFALFAMLCVLGVWAYHRIGLLSAETIALRSELERKISAERANTEEEYRRVRDGLLMRMDGFVRRESDRLKQRLFEHDVSLAKIDKNVSELVSKADEMLFEFNARVRTEAELDHAIAEIEDGLHSLEADLDLARRSETDSKEKIEELQNRIGEQESAIKSMSEERASLQEKVGKLEEYKARLSELSGAEKDAARAEQKKTISDNNLRALQKKYRALAKHSDAQKDRLDEAYAHIKAARQQLESLRRKS